MKITLLLFVLVGTALAGCGKPQPSSYDSMTSPQRMEFLRSQAEAAIKTECTNLVPGIRNFVNLQSNVLDNSLARWSGSATLDYINPVGGVERTNLQFVFKSSSTGRLYCLLNDDEPAKRDTGNLPPLQEAEFTAALTTLTNVPPLQDSGTNPRIATAYDPQTGEPIYDTEPKALSISTRIMETNDSAWRYSFTLQVYNPFYSDQTRNIAVRFMGADGSLLDEKQLSNVTFTAFTTNSISDTVSVAASVANRVKKFDARIEK